LSGWLWKALLLAVVVSVVSSGCMEWPPGESGVAKLRKFASAAGFKQYLANQITAERSRNWWNIGFEAADGSLPQPSAPRPLGTSAPADDGFSTTNIQEVGLDESDVVKNDGTYLYILGSHQVRIVRAVPADDMQIVSTVELPSQAAELYLRNDKLIALGSGHDWETHTDITTITIVDVTDRSAPAVQATIEAQGSLITSRLISSKLHLVMSMWPTLRLGERGLPVLVSNTDALLPDITVTLGDGKSETRNLVGWDDLYHPVDPDGYHVTAVVTLNVDAPDEPRRSVGVMANAGTVYVSTEAMYLTDTDYNHMGEIRETTDIYKFDLEEDGAVPAGAGSVPGRVLNRFSLGEHQGHLRIATTIGHVSRSGENDAINNVYVLGPEKGELVIVGKVEGVAPGERIYAARFLGDRGFLVTFKKVDPLFTLDLSDPASPRVVGELKVPGYSDYIHPLGDNHLLTIGKDAVDMGDFAWYQGVQISVFDVTEFADPQLVDAEVVGDRGTESEALHNPHAFTFFAPVDMLAVPMTIAGEAGQEPSDFGVPIFQGLCLFRVTTEGGIEPVVRIATEFVENLPHWGYWRGYDWVRGIFIGDHVYAVTSSVVYALPLGDLGDTPQRLILE